MNTPLNLSPRHTALTSLALALVFALATLGGVGALADAPAPAGLLAATHSTPAQG